MENWSRYSELYNISSFFLLLFSLLFHPRNKKGETSRSCGRNSAVWLAIFAAWRGDRKDNRDGPSRTFISTFTTPGRAPLTLRIATPCFSPPPRKKKKRKHAWYFQMQSYVRIRWGVENCSSRRKRRRRGGSGRQRERERGGKKRATSEARFPFSTFYNPRARKGYPYCTT